MRHFTTQLENVLKMKQIKAILIVALLSMGIRLCCNCFLS